MNSILTLLKPSDYVTTQWSGGSTTQLAIAPTGAVYADRDFLWRISSATVELDESDFTPLPDYHRFISTVRGDMVLSHNGGEELTLHPGDIHEFEGGDTTHSRGRCTDFNLMLRKGKADGSIRSLFLAGEVNEFSPDPRSEQLLIYCASGKCAILYNNMEYTITAGESLYADDKASTPLVFSGSEAMVMVAEMWKRQSEAL